MNINLEALFEQVQTLIAQFGLRVIAAIAIFMAGRWAAQFLKRLIRRGMDRAGIEPTVISFTANLSYYGMIVVVLLVVLAQLGIQTTSLVAVLGATGLAIGLALQGSLANFAAGILIVIFRPFRVGDWIHIGDISGFVEEIQLFTTAIRTLDNKTAIVPNSSLTADNIVNYSTKGILRIDLVIGVAYEEDVDRVKQVLMDVLQANERVLSEPAPMVGLLELADSSVNFAVRPWVKTEDYWNVYFTTMENIKKRLDAEGITIPFPQRDVHFYPQN